MDWRRQPRGWDNPGVTGPCWHAARTGVRGGLAVLSSPEGTKAVTERPKGGHSEGFRQGKTCQKLGQTSEAELSTE